MYIMHAAAPPGFRFGGNTLGGRRLRGPGADHPLMPENFQKFAKKFIEKIAKMHHFSLFSKKFKTLR